MRGGGGNKMEKGPAEKLAEKEFNEFNEQLKSAICLVSGIPDDRWRDFSLEKVFTELHKNGIYICFRMDPEKFYNKIFGPEGIP